MAKWNGKIGFATTVQIEPGLWEPSIVEQPYYGDILDDTIKRQNSGGIIDNIDISKRISIVADPFADTNIPNMVYIEYMGAKWKITDVSPQRPRLIISVGGVYNGQQTSTAE